MDEVKKPLGVLTMAYQDYFFVERWYRYWSAQIGAENLYLLSHGNDPTHREIAQQANVMNLPRDESMFKFDLRRWRAMGFIASGLLEFYQRMIVTDVDEIVIADPAAASSVADWLARNASGPKAPVNISPLCLELVHVPQQEPDPISDDATILSRRRIFRPNANYSKPCVVGAPVLFGPGGHRNNLGPRVLPENLYLLHLKYFDRDRLVEASERRRRLSQTAAIKGNLISGWNNNLQSYEDILENMPVAGEDIALPQFREQMQKQRLKFTNQYVWGKAKSDKLYRIPDRFAKVF